MTDLLIRMSGAIVESPKCRVNGHGWVEHHDENGSIIGLTPPSVVSDVVVGAERFIDIEEVDSVEFKDFNEVGH